MNQRLSLWSDLITMGATALEAAEILELSDDMTAIELASKAYLHEHRNRGGEWTGMGMGELAGASLGKAQRRQVKSQAARGTKHPARGLLPTQPEPRPATAHAPASGGGPAIDGQQSPPPPPPPDNTAHSKAFQTHVAQSNEEHKQLQAAMEAHHQEVLAKMDAQGKEHVAMMMKTVEQKNAELKQNLAQEADTSSKHAARQKAAVEGGIAVAGLAAAYAEQKMGVPGLMALITPTLATAGQVLVEWKKRL